MKDSPFNLSSSKRSRSKGGRDIGVNPIKLYLNDIEKIPLLSREEEIKLAKLVQKGNQQARLTLIRSNLRLVVKIARRYSGYGMPLLDLIEEGNLGLMKSVTKFDHSKGFRFNTYATWWIRQSIIRSFADQGKTIRVPVYMTELVQKVKKKAHEISQKNGVTPTYEEIANSLDIPSKKVRIILEAGKNQQSLNASLDDGIGVLMDVLYDKKSQLPSQSIFRLIQKERVEALLKEYLTEKEFSIISVRFGLKDGIPKTLEETGKCFQLTRERIRQIAQKSIEKLKNMSKQESQELYKIAQSEI